MCCSFCCALLCFRVVDMFNFFWKICFWLVVFYNFWRQRLDYELFLIFQRNFLLFGSKLHFWIFAVNFYFEITGPGFQVLEYCRISSFSCALLCFIIVDLSIPPRSNMWFWFVVLWRLLSKRLDYDVGPPMILFYFFHFFVKIYVWCSSKCEIFVFVEIMGSDFQISTILWDFYFLFSKEEISSL